MVTCLGCPEAFTTLHELWDHKANDCPAHKVAPICGRRGPRRRVLRLDSDSDSDSDSDRLYGSSDVDSD